MSRFHPAFPQMRRGVNGTDELSWGKTCFAKCPHAGVVVVCCTDGARTLAPAPWHTSRSPLGRFAGEHAVIQMMLITPKCDPYRGSRSRLLPASAR